MKILSLLVAALVVASTAGDATPKKESWNADILSGRRSLQNLPPFQDPSLRIHLASIFSQLPVLSQFETPIAIRWTSLIDAVFWNCVATYSDAYKDALTRQRPLVSGVPKAMYNDNNKLMCGLNAFAVFLTMALPPGVPLFQGAATQLGITVEFNKLPAVQSCTDGPSGDLASCLNSVAQGNEHSSAVVGNIVGVLAAEHAFADGWNQLGTEKCTANCRAYADTTNYRPFKLPLSGYGRSFLRLPRIPWQPLVEDNGKGFFYRQEHVTPHIGKKGVSRFLSSEDRFKRKLPYHSYDYRKEIPKVLRRMRALDDKRKLEIEFHDNKLEIAANAYIGFVLAYNPSYDEAMRFIASYTAGEYDATMVVWGEKIRQSLVRPTTLIKWRGGKCRCCSRQLYLLISQCEVELILTYCLQEESIHGPDQARE